MRKSALECLISLLTALLMMLPVPGVRSTAAETPEAGVSRCLLIGCDSFLSMPSTAPVSANNVQRTARMMEACVPGLVSVRSSTDGPGSSEALRALILEAFQGAGEEDTSWLYLSTHGVTWTAEEELRMALLLSDGESEEALEAGALRAILDEVPGKKVLILDACHAGAMIGKGVSGTSRNAFAAPDYRVLVSCGGEEESWMWSAAGDEHSGAGYFTAALEAVLEDGRTDRNEDGVLSLGEICAALRRVHGASTAYCYPEEDAAPLMIPGKETDRALHGLTFEEQKAEEGSGVSVSFRFTVSEPARVYYRLAAFRDGVWNFAGAQKQPDRERTGSVRGLLAPGGKTRSVRLTTVGGAESGWALLEILTVENGSLQLAGSRALYLPDPRKTPETVIMTAEAFTPGKGEELQAEVRTDSPCSLTVWAADEGGNRLRQLTPQEIVCPRGAFLYWNGTLENGEPAPEGIYRMLVRTAAGEKTQEILSAPFRLIREDPENGKQEKTPG